jgi:hypothetical protein
MQRFGNPFDDVFIDAIGDVGMWGGEQTDDARAAEA